jgi:hypothetical protein
MAESKPPRKPFLGDWVRFIEDTQCLCPMDVKDAAFDGYVIVHMPKHPNGPRDGLVKRQEIVCMTHEEVARHG